MSPRAFKAIENAEEDIFPDPFAAEYARQIDEGAKAVERENAAGIQSLVSISV